MVVFALGFFVWAIDAQDADESAGPEPIGGLAFVDELEVTVVNVVAIVTNKKGEVITGLTKEDFRIFHDGEERPITNFQPYTEELIRDYYAPKTLLETGEPEAEEAPPMPELQIEPVYMLIFIDHDNSDPLDRNRVLSQTRTFIRENVQPPVNVMVVSYVKSLNIVQPFTDDSTQVLRALRDMKMTTGGRSNRDSSREEIYRVMEESQHHQDRQAVSDSYSRARGMVYGFAEEEVNDLQFTLSALREAVNLMAGLSGKKSILYVSNGLPMVPAIDLYYAMANAYNEPGLISEAMRFNQTRQFESLVKNANAQGITLYTIGAGGLSNPSLGSAQHRAARDTQSALLGHDNYLDSLRYMAEETGGVAIVNTNDISSGLEKVEQDFYTYYSLGYNLQMSGSDKVHRIKLTLPDHPDYRLRYRKRFVEKSLESRVRDKVLTSLVVPTESNPLDLMLETGDHAPASADRWTVPIKLSFPIRRVALLPAGNDYVNNVVLYVAARDAEGRQSDLVRQEHEVRVPAADYDEAQLRRFTISASLLMQEGNYKISVGLLDPITRQAAFRSSSVIIRP
jgi:VWFA-related protein